MLANPALNYAQFLLRAVLPTVLHVVVAISAGFAVGSEFRRRSMRAWWDISGHSFAAALVGKLLPYYVVLMLMFVLMVGILDVWLGVSFRGSAVLIAVSATLLIVAYQMIGGLMQLLARNMALGLSLTGIIVSPAFGYAGVGFPVLAMQALSPRVGRDPAAALVYPDPVRPGLARRRGAVHGRAVRDPVQPHDNSCTAGLASLPRAGPARPVRSRRGRAGGRARMPGFAGAFAAEWRRVLSDRGVFSLFVLAPVLYAFFYPQPYLGQIVRNVPIAVVDQDNTELARGLIQTLEAHGNISVALARHELPGSGGRDPRPSRLRHPGHPPGYREERAEGRRRPACRSMPNSTYFILFNRALQGMLESVQAYAADAAPAAHGARAPACRPPRA